MNKTIRLKKFNLNNIKDGEIMYIIGSKGAGKTTLIKDILNKKVYDQIYVFSPSIHINEYNDVTSSLNQFDKYDDTRIGNIIKNKEFQKKNNMNYQTVIVIDDCFQSKSQFNKKNFREMFFNGKHLNISLILTSQYYMSLPHIINNNVDHTFVLKCYDISLCVDKLYQNCGHIVNINKNILKQLLKKSSVNYEMLVINEHAINSELNNTLFWYKANYSSKASLINYNNKLDYYSINNVTNTLYNYNNCIYRKTYNEYNNNKGSYGILVKDNDNIVINKIAPLIPLISINNDTNDTNKSNKYNDELTELVKSYDIIEKLDYEEYLL
jgi:tRNA A37 threonylcarbamoyladenosine biosynthesis protein TsaE